LTATGRIWLDGHHVPPPQVGEIFRTPPGFSGRANRSAIVIGSHGAGKTLLLRNSAHQHEGIAVSISLAAEFGPLQKTRNLGPYASNIPPPLGPLISAKALTLLALGLAREYATKVGSVDSLALRECCPPDISVPAELTTNDIKDLIRAVAPRPFEGFSRVGEHRSLIEFANSLADQAWRDHGPLLIALDRGDMVAAPALEPVFQLLDQESQPVTLVAMRPGVVALTSSLEEPYVIIGDHCDEIHLGLEPDRANGLVF
jgi:hypothetical protein